MSVLVVPPCAHRSPPHTWALHTRSLGRRLMRLSRYCWARTGFAPSPSLHSTTRRQRCRALAGWSKVTRRRRFAEMLCLTRSDGSCLPTRSEQGFWPSRSTADLANNGRFSSPRSTDRARRPTRHALTVAPRRRQIAKRTTRWNGHRVRSKSTRSTTPRTSALSIPPACLRRDSRTKRPRLRHPRPPPPHLRHSPRPADTPYPTTEVLALREAAPTVAPNGRALTTAITRLTKTSSVVDTAADTAETTATSRTVPSAGSGRGFTDGTGSDVC
ncbi:hypothetical protein AAT19DRAFT_11698 [Rhodotorula toruloides]|uniref:Uncharacterized protein n=1 Tax=Rhodotorula toruloides TaxID=5286 RepID=A0A2S9ZWC1_RHOTO|nr:hypothetical protein AAT19DRAFT_11698 [Rhodotorula toruloides]